MNLRSFVVLPAVAGILAAGALVAPTAASAELRADRDLSYDNPRYEDSAALDVEGTIETTVIDGFGEDGGASYEYGVRVEDGGVIPLPASFGKSAPNGGDFKGKLAVTGELANDLRDEGVDVAQGETIDADSADGETAVDLASELETPVPVVSATVTEPVAEAMTPSSHRLYVAILSNRGTMAATSGAITAMRNYWLTESDGAITEFPVASTKTYASAVTATDNCGLAGGHNAIWAEAAGKFPGVDFSAGGNHLMVMVPGACSGAAGIGTVGTSINGGGKSIISAGASATQIGAHELGHNFGLGHANLERCLSTCSTFNYYNAYSVMGFAISAYAPPALSTVARRFLRLGDTTSDVVVPGVTTVDLKPRSDPAGRRGLRVVDPLTSAEFFIEYRSGTGRDASSYYAKGGALSSFRYSPGVVVTQYTSQSPGRHTKVLTRRVSTSDYAYLSSGASFRSSSGGVLVKVNSLSGSTGARVTVSLVAGPVSPSAVPEMAFADGVAPRSGSTVTAVEGTWDSGTTFTYRWRVDGNAISGATGRTYVVPGAYYKRNLSVTVTGSKPGFRSTSHRSSSVPVQIGTLTSVTPRISGTLRVGRTLTAIRGVWTSGTSFKYRWYADGVAITGATSKYYTISRYKRGKQLSVRVTGYKYGFTTTSLMSPLTAKVE
ncbi:reprolysin-like metallopeptidase [Aeromicrobium sp.]|uniref:reprolysin-like metallopeptidase n=1 Tax=Aeromicrobium sp. TaxID=1871063 RepID=UPI002FC810E3